MVDQTGSVVQKGVVNSDPEAISVYVRSMAPDADELVLAAIAQNLRRLASLAARPPPTQALCTA